MSEVTERNDVVVKLSGKCSKIEARKNGGYLVTVTRPALDEFGYPSNYPIYYQKRVPFREGEAVNIEARLVTFRRKGTRSDGSVWAGYDLSLFAVE